ncbi:MAG TPA: CheR family methyltransferase [Segetibacter sp.]|nr:CheR family methyltransferase [Segetibacter sp.]
MEGYVDYIKEHPQEIDSLYADLLINVTHFFRDEETSEYLAKELLPKILKTKPQQETLRIWIPACSTGEEVYSMAMILLELLEENSFKVRVHIFGTDLSETVISKARAGIYTIAEVANVPEKRLKHFFTKVDGHYRVSKALRDVCVFAPHNIFKDPPFSKIDIISCCNLLIYLDNVLQKIIFSNLHYSLNRSGYLILGKSEALGDSGGLYTQLDKNLKIFQKKNDVTSGSGFNTSFHLPMIEKSNNVKGFKTPLPLPPDQLTLHKVVDNIFLTKYTLPGVVINNNMEILQFRGSTALFLEHSHGTASLNLLKMSRPGLSFELKSAVLKVIQTRTACKKTGIPIENKGVLTHVDFEVSPIEFNNGEPLLLVVFEEQKLGTSVELEGPQKVTNRERQLEAELNALRSEMRSVVEEQEAAYEELQAANEEILSSNEELQSLNEELETSKEEIEASNEELLTINYELNTRNEQLAELYDYNKSIFTTIRECLITLDKKLRVKTANAAFYKTFKVSEAETVGRLIYEIGNRQWDLPILRQLLENIIPQKLSFEGYVVEHEFENIGKKVMLLNARKVLQKVHLDEVILLAIEDITEHKQAESLLKEREGWLRNMTNNVPVMIWVSGTDKKFTFLNNTWLQYTGRSLDEESGVGWMDGVKAEDLPGLLNVYDTAYQNQHPFKVEYRMKRFDNEYRWVINSAVPAFVEEKFTGFIGSCTEIHDERKVNLELEEKIQERTHQLTQLNKDLEQSNSELQQFAFIASHDLQEPLRKVTTFINKIKDILGNQLDDKVATLLSKTMLSTERMRNLIDDVLNFSKMSRLSGNFIPTDLNNIINSVLIDLELLIEEKNAKLSIGSLPVLNAIPLQISQLFYNLLHNALKFSKPTGEVMISISCKDLSDDDRKNYKLKEEVSYYLISVEDNGIGFSQDYSEQIFEIFQRLNNKINHGGTGIGLALCRKIVNNHGGIITAKSEEGQGAEFKIILPAS